MKQSQLNELNRTIASIKMSSNIALASKKIQVSLQNRNAMRVSHQQIEYSATSISYNLDYTSYALSSSDRYTVLISETQQNDSELVSWHLVPFELVRTLVDLVAQWLNNSMYGNDLLYIGLPKHKTVFCQTEDGCGWAVDTENSSYIPFLQAKEEVAEVNFLSPKTLARLRGNDEDEINEAAKMLN
jgi:hypothetical protein